LYCADAVTAPSRAFLSDVLALFPSIQERGSFIHNGIDLHELNLPPRKKADSDHQRYLLSIAAFNRKKALDVLLIAFGSVKDVDTSLRLVVVGDGPLRTDLEHLAERLTIRDRIAFVGLKGRAEIAKLLHGCEVFVLPSRSEPFGIVILEAMACGKPVVASAVGGIPEIIEDGITGILVEPDNPIALAKALRALLTDSSLQRSICKKAHERAVSRFQWKHTGAGYLRLFHGLLSQHQGDFSPSSSATTF
jgi:starch synthase